MEALNILEQKVTELVAKVSDLQNQNEILCDEVESLREKNEILEDALLKNREDSDQEKELTKMVVDSLIQNVDSALNKQAE